MIEPIGSGRLEKVTFFVKDSQAKGKDKGNFDKDDFDKDNFEKNEQKCPGYVVHIMPCNGSHKGCKLNYLA